MVTSCCNWLSEFLGADTSVVRAIKGVVSAGHDTRLKDALDIERYSVHVFEKRVFVSSNGYETIPTWVQQGGFIWWHQLVKLIITMSTGISNCMNVYIQLRIYNTSDIWKLTQLHEPLGEGN